MSMFQVCMFVYSLICSLHAICIAFTLTQLWVWVTCLIVLLTIFVLSMSDCYVVHVSTMFVHFSLSQRYSCGAIDVWIHAFVLLPQCLSQHICFSSSFKHTQHPNLQVKLRQDLQQYSIKFKCICTTVIYFVFSHRTVRSSYFSMAWGQIYTPLWYSYKAAQLDLHQI